MAPSPNSYDELPYEACSHPQSHPDRLATIGTLFGMEPAPLQACRVLEVGCATGANVVPMAAALPGSCFVGVDFSKRQIAAAQECSTALGFTNIVWQAADFCEVGESLGTFDYIIAHGVYSWVAEPVREKLLGLCAAALNPAGIAYISYNTLPGSNAREALRQMARLRLTNAEATPAAVAETRALFGFFQSACAARGDGFAHVMGEELQAARALADSHFAHEYLEPANEPCFFHEFAARAGAHGLQFLAEAELQAMSPTELPSPARAELRQLARNLIQAEQYLDLIRNRAFRQTLLCHASVPLKRSVAPGSIADFHIASALQPDGSGGFVGSDAATFRAEDPFTFAALSELAETWPQSWHFPELIARAAARIGVAAEPAVVRAFQLSLIAAHASSAAIEFRTTRASFTSQVSEFPMASPLARWQAARGTQITNARHENVRLGEAERGLFRRLDGSNARSALAADARLQEFAGAALLVG